MAFHPELLGNFDCISCKHTFKKNVGSQKICSGCRPSYTKRHSVENWKKWYLKNKNKAQANNKKWYLKNKEVLENRYRESRSNRVRKWRKNNPERRKMLSRSDGARRKNAGKLGIKLLQKVYEENINKYKTLTCILCMKPIDFGQDSLEHKIPVSRGGLNAFDNLGISHRKCNLMKHTKTVEEYLIGK